MPISALDSRIFCDLIETQEIRHVFEDNAYIVRLVEVEAALARAQAKCAVIPDEAGQAITEVRANVKLDLEKLSRDTEIVGYPVLPFVEQLVAHMPAEVAKYIHRGATTQDIMDNASRLQIVDTVKIAKRELQKLARILESLATR